MGPESECPESVQPNIEMARASDPALTRIHRCRNDTLRAIFPSESFSEQNITLQTEEEREREIV